MGEPKLFWGVSGGSIDSMVSNYTATKSLGIMMITLQVEKTINDQIEATLVYTNLIRRYFKIQLLLF